jgi:hypothetical protein
LIKTDYGKKGRRRLYNKIYRKSGLFVLAWVVRLAYVILFIFACFLHGKRSSHKMEVVLNKEIESYTYVSAHSAKNGTDLYIETDYDSYNIDISRMSFPNFNIGDTLLIERNLFGKPIYFGKTGWTVVYSIGIRFGFYFAVLFATLISLAFNNGLDRFTNKLLKLITVTNLFAMGCYFFG